MITNDDKLERIANSLVKTQPTQNNLIGNMSVKMVDALLAETIRQNRADLVTVT